MRLIGPFTRIGLIAAVLAAATDQMSKLGLLASDLMARKVIGVTPFMDLVVAWNTGISYGLFSQETELGRWMLIAIKAAASLFLWVWLARAQNRIEAAGLGLILGGAIGNGLDRIVHGAVFDFVSLHAFGYRWYVFNIADVAIVAGVAALMYDSLFSKRATGSP